MPKNWFHILYTAIGVFVSVFLVAIYTRPATAMPPVRAPIAPITQTIQRETVFVIYKYLSLEPKPVLVDVVEKK